MIAVRMGPDCNEKLNRLKNRKYGGQTLIRRCVVASSAQLKGDNQVSFGPT